MSRISGKNLNKLIKMARGGNTIEEKFLMNLINFIQERKPREVSMTYKPSSLHCMRNMYYQMIGKIQDKNCQSAELIGIGESGSARHEHIQKYISDMCTTKENYEWVDVADYIKEHKLDYLEVVSKNGFETKCRHTVLNLSFMCDGILKIDGEYILFEYKTESCFKFGNRKGVAEEHENQAACYSLAFDIPKVLFIYENRDMCGKKAFMYKVTASKKQEILDKILECDNYIEAGKVPPKEPHKGCKYCKYKSSCEVD